MDLSRAVYSHDLNIAAMRQVDAGSAAGEIARKYQLSPKLLERWRESGAPEGNWPSEFQGLFTRQQSSMAGLPESFRIYGWQTPPLMTPVEMEMRDELQKIALDQPTYG